MKDNLEKPDYADVLIGGVEKVEIRVVDYDPQWIARFYEHAGRITATLGATALRVEHIGSTSVAGLAAKPIIDIMLVVPDVTDENAYAPALIARGYQMRVREPDHRMLRTQMRDTHIHVYSQGNEEIDRLLAFRDRLREHADERELYAQLKRELAKRNWRDMNAYADAKTEVIKAIVARAQGEVT